VKLSIIGAGKLGLPLGGVLAEAGHEVIVTDVNDTLIEALRTGTYASVEPDLDDLLARTKLQFTTDVAGAARDTEVSFIVVPTPSNQNDEFSNEFVLQAIASIGEGIAGKVAEHTVVLVSTVMPGASTDIIIPALEAHSGREIGVHLNYAYSPEFVALGSIIANMKSPDFLLIGEANRRAGTVLSFIYHTYLVYPQIVRVSVIDAEIAKLSINCYLTVKISFANMISELCEAFKGASARAVCDAIGQDRRIGPDLLREGTASAGPCLPRDLRALSRAMFVRNLPDEMVWAANRVNKRQVQRLRGMALSFGPKKVAVLGISYKPNTFVTDASVGLALMGSLEQRGAKVQGYDPMAVFPGQAVTIGAALAHADVVVITTAWPEFAAIDYGETHVIDCFGIAKYGRNIHRLGFG